MAARRNRRGRRRNRGRFGALYKVLSALVIVAAILAGCVVFFRVNTVLVDGQCPYTKEEIIAASGVEQGDNLFGLDKGRISSRIYTQLPYIDEVSINCKLPDTLVFRVSQSIPVACLKSGGSYWLLDTKCKILESGDASLAEGRALLYGLEAVNPTVGSVLTVAPEQQEKLDRLRAFLAAIRERQMTGSITSFIDLTSDNEIRFGYGENLTVVMPLNGDFTEKTYDLKRALETMDERGITRTGTLDLNYETREGHLLPERWLPTTSADSVPATQSSPAPDAEGKEEGETNEANQTQ
ncbi:cell division protein FtsQ/DivIB [Flavonifractor hominis]|uniref:FtsQ-type POTRA domain-containing protein n=1 Tax=Flavonifractor hominis TaxID=3133178 RepID=A0ABV1ES18_9FIRM